MNENFLFLPFYFCIQSVRYTCESCLLMHIEIRIFEYSYTHADTRLRVSSTNLQFVKYLKSTNSIGYLTVIYFFNLYKNFFNAKHDKYTDVSDLNFSSFIHLSDAKILSSARIKVFVCKQNE